VRTQVRASGRRGGFALVIVMLVIVVLATLAAGFAYSMKLEMQLARSMTFDAESLWLGRSGVELARYVLAMKSRIPGEAQFDSLDQKWAGGLGGTDDFLVDVALEDNPLGPGRFSVHIIDLERKLNLNAANRELVQKALEILDCDNLSASVILDSIEDWRDPNQDQRINGAETDFYLRQEPPYIAKDGQFDDISELLLVRGVTQELYWGSRGSPATTPIGPTSGRGQPAPFVPMVGLVDLFTTFGAPRVNVNTASAEVLQLLPGMDRNLAEGVVNMRAGPDGVDGTGDDTPLHNVGELINVPGLPPQQVDLLRRVCDVRSLNFEVRVDVEIGGRRRTYVALVTRAGGQNVQVLNAYWE
jgi:type II secretory pathway component PulK